MKLLFFIESLNCGGAEKSIVSLLQLLDYSRVSVDLMLVNPNGDFSHLVPKEVNIINFPSPKGLKAKIAKTVFSLRWRILKILDIKRHHAEIFWSSLSKVMSTFYESYDVAVAYQQGLPTYYLADYVKAKKKLAWINVDIKAAGYRESFNRKFYNKYDIIVPVSKELDATLRTQNFAEPSKLSILYDILNADIIKALAKETAIEQPKDKISFVTVGRLQKQKNYPLAVETAKLLRDKGYDFTWTFVGEGSERQNIEALIAKYNLEDYIHLAGLQINPYPYIASADIYVQTSSFEGFGLTIAEAKILGKPIVSTNFNVVYDQLTDGVNGLIAEMTPESVAKKIVTLLENKDLMDNIVSELAKERNTTAETEVCKFYKLIGLSS